MKTMLAALSVGFLLMLGGLLVTFNAAQDAREAADRNAATALHRAISERKRADYELCLHAKANRGALVALVGAIPEPFRAPYAATISPPIVCRRP